MNKYEPLTTRGEVMLVNTLMIAKKLGHKVKIKNYSKGYMREQGYPDCYDFDFKSIIHGNTIDTDEMPSYERDGSNSVVISIGDGAELYEYNIWYSDNSEDRIYIDEIKNYLEAYEPTALRLVNLPYKSKN